MEHYVSTDALKSENVSNFQFHIYYREKNSALVSFSHWIINEIKLNIFTFNLFRKFHMPLELDAIHMDYGLKQIDWNLSHNKYEFDNDDESCECVHVCVIHVQVVYILKSLHWYMRRNENGQAVTRKINKQTEWERENERRDFIHFDYKRRK